MCLRRSKKGWCESGAMGRPHRLLAKVRGMLSCIQDAKRHVEPLRNEAVRLQAVLCAESDKDSNDVRTDVK